MYEQSTELSNQEKIPFRHQSIWLKEFFKANWKKKTQDLQKSNTQGGYLIFIIILIFRPAFLPFDSRLRVESSPFCDNSFDENTCHRLDQENNANSAGGDSGDKYELWVWDIYDSIWKVIWTVKEMWPSWRNLRLSEREVFVWGVRVERAGQRPLSKTEKKKWRQFKAAWWLLCNNFEPIGDYLGTVGDQYVWPIGSTFRPIGDNSLTIGGAFLCPRG